MDAPPLGEALDRAALRRMRVFHTFGVIAPVVGVPLSLLLGGDPLARALFCIGLTIHASSNVAMLALVRTREAMSSPLSRALWVAAGVGLVPAVYYFGPFSAVVMILFFGVLITAMGADEVVATSIATFAVAAHLGIVVPMIAGRLADVGLVSHYAFSPAQAAIVEALIVGFLGSGYAIGRWIRRTSADALAELADARRVIGDQQQQLVELNVHAERANRPNEGRWTGQRLGSWQLGLVLGRGAMGEVYEATSPEWPDAAVKVLAPRGELSVQVIERFHRELEVAARLVSPHIVRVYEVSPPDAPCPYLAMERLRGFDLASRLRDDARLAVEDMIAMLAQIARGLETAHGLGVVHRDLKPHNLFHDGQWKILDFGVAKLLGTEGTLTEGMLVGTPSYMAPEQAGGAAVTHLADIYSLGAIAYRCLTGRTPFAGSDVPQTVYHVVHDPPPRPSEFGVVSPAIEDVLAVAMAKAPDRRFRSAHQFVEQLELARRTGRALVDVPARAWS